MVRLIDADAIEHCLVIGGRRHGKTIISEIIRRAIQTAPTVDAVPVIRCKDCKHWQYESCFVESEECNADSIILDRFAFDFCSRAERKE